MQAAAVVIVLDELPQVRAQVFQMAISVKAVELIADSPFSDLSLTPEQASTVVREEKAERAFPT